jgi:hypothetical protein
MGGGVEYFADDLLSVFFRSLVGFQTRAQIPGPMLFQVEVRPKGFSDDSAGGDAVVGMVKPDRLSRSRFANGACSCPGL